MTARELLRAEVDDLLRLASEGFAERWTCGRPREDGACPFPAPDGRPCFFHRIKVARAALRELANRIDMEMEYADPERKGQTVGMERLLRVGAWTVLARLDADLNPGSTKP